MRSVGERKHPGCHVWSWKIDLDSSMKFLILARLKCNAPLLFTSNFENLWSVRKADMNMSIYKWQDWLSFFIFLAGSTRKDDRSFFSGIPKIYNFIMDHLVRDFSVIQRVYQWRARFQLTIEFSRPLGFELTSSLQRNTPSNPQLYGTITMNFLVNSLKLLGFLIDESYDCVFEPSIIVARRSLI